VTQIDVTLIDRNRLFDESVAAWSPSGAAITKAEQRWGQLWANYKSKLPLRGAHAGERLLRIPVTVHTEDSSVVFLNDVVEVPFGPDFFRQLVRFYGRYGWEGVDSLIANLVSQTETVKTLIGAAIVELETLIAPALIRIESAATALAKDQTGIMLDLVASHEGLFHKDEYWKSWRLPTGEGTDQVRAKLQDIRRVQRDIASLQPKIDERIRADGGDSKTVQRKRRRDAYRRLLAEQWEGPQRANFEKLGRLQEELGVLCPPASLIVDDLDDTIFEWLDLATARKSTNTVIKNRSIAVEVDYGGRMHAAVVTLRKALSLTATSLSNPGMSATIFQLLDQAPERRWRAGGLHAGVIAEAARMEKLTEKTSSYFSVNRILGRDAILLQTLDRIVTTQTGSFEQMVAFHYLLDLKRDLARKRQEDAFYESVWHFVEQSVAAVALLIAVLSIPFGAGEIAVPAAMTAFLSTLSTVTAILSIAMLARHVANALGELGGASGTVANVLVDTGMKDAEAMQQLSQVLCRHRLLLKSITTDLLKEVAAMALAHKLKPLSYALQIRGHYYDLEAVGAPI